MPQYPPVDTRPARWRPQWAFAIAIILLVPSVGTFGLGLLTVIGDLLDDTDWLHGVGVLLGTIIGVPGLLTAIPLVIFLARRGGRVPFFIGLGLAAAAVIGLTWFFVAVG